MTLDTPIKSLTPIAPRPAELDAETFDAAEAVIERGQKTFLEVGRALLTIKTQGLTELKRRGFQNFGDYMQKRWGWSRDYGQRLVAAANVVENLRKNVDNC